MRTIALGDRGPSVVEIRSLLQDLRLLPTGDAAPAASDPAAMVFDDACALAVRQFQQERGLVADGRVDDDTYNELAGSRHQLGSRAMRYADPMQRGDDVRQLQQQLTELGFHHGNVDGIFGRTTETSLRAFQHDYGLQTDGVAAASTLRALGNLLPKVTGGSATLLRSQAHRVSSGPQLAGRLIYFEADDEADGFTWNLAGRVRDHLEMLGANAILINRTTAGRPASERAERANRAGAEIFISLQVASHIADQAEGMATYYFGSASYLSTVGREIAGFLHREVTSRGPFVDLGVHPRVLEILRLTTMPAVLLEIGHATNPADRARMSDPQVCESIAEGMVAAIQRFYLATADDYPTGTWRLPR